VCDLHHTHGGDENHMFSSWSQNHCDSFLVCTSKPRSTIWWFVPQNYRGDFLVWDSNQVGWGLSFCASKPMNRWRRCEGTRQHPTACFTVKQVRLGFPSFVSKLAKEQRRVVHMASLRRSHGSEVKDDKFDGIRCDVVEVKPYYPSLDVIFLLVHRAF
jgi:hypothetical protein